MNKAQEVLSIVVTEAVTKIKVDSSKGKTEFALGLSKDGVVSIKPMNSSELYFLAKPDAKKMASKLVSLSA